MQSYAEYLRAAYGKEKAERILKERDRLPTVDSARVRKTIRPEFNLWRVKKAK